MLRGASAVENSLNRMAGNAFSGRTVLWTTGVEAGGSCGDIGDMSPRAGLEPFLHKVSGNLSTGSSAVCSQTGMAVCSGVGIFLLR